MSSVVISMASGSVENLLAAATLTGGAIALDMDVDIYLLLGGAYAFRKDVAEKGAQYFDRPELKEEMLEGMRKNYVGMPLDSLRKHKQQGRVKIHVCSTAGKIWGATTREDFSDLVDDIVGIAACITQGEKADLHFTL